MNRRDVLRLGAQSVVATALIPMSTGCSKKPIETKAKIVVIGAGFAGLTVIRELSSRVLADICVYDPQNERLSPFVPHLFMGNFGTFKSSEYIPGHISYKQEAIIAIDPASKTIKTASSTTKFDILIVAAGTIKDYSSILNIESALKSPNVISVLAAPKKAYDFYNGKDFASKRCVFASPSSFCSGGLSSYSFPFLFKNKHQRAAVSAYSGRYFAFDNKEMDSTLQNIAAELDVKITTKHNLSEIYNGTAVFTKIKRYTIKKPDGKTETYEDFGGKTTVDFDYLHFIPPMKAPGFILQSGLNGADGRTKKWLNVTQDTLTHPKHKNIFGLGDVIGQDTKSIGAIKKQSEVIVDNIISLLENKPLDSFYDGYVEHNIYCTENKVFRAETDYFKEPVSSSLIFSSSGPSYISGFYCNSIAPRKLL